jgi:hypothetical protein
MAQAVHARGIHARGLGGGKVLAVGGGTNP